MGQGLSCRVPNGNEHELFTCVQNGEFETVETLVDEDPTILGLTTVHGRLSALHVAATNGQLQVCFIRSCSVCIQIFLSC